MADLQRKTANLFDKTAEYTVGVTTYNYTISGLDPNKYYTCSTNFERISGVDAASIYFNGGNSAINGVWSNTPRTFKPDSNGEIIVYIRYLSSTDIAPPIIDDVMEGTIWVMVNEGSTPLPYEPYGWLHSLRKLATATDTFTTLPVDVYADGNNATVGISGNTVQNGTPTPSNPVDVNGVGEKTANLLDMSTVSVGYHLDITTGLPIGFGNSRMATLAAIDVSQFSAVTLAYTSVGDTIQFMYSIFDGTDTLIERVAGKESGDSIDVSSAAKLYIAFYRNAALTINSVEEPMLNEGATPQSYEPYGYKIPILSNSTTTPIYLGEVQSTRRIKKLVLDGKEEGWTKNDPSNPSNTLYYKVGFLANKTCVCSHLENMGTLSLSKVGVFNGNNVLYLNFGSAIMNAQTSGNTVNGLKEYLAAQYAAGTPVIVWYVLATETTGTVNEPLMKIGDYADTVSGITIPTITGKVTFDVETTLKPSEASLSYTGWHDASVKEKSENLWNEDYTDISSTAKYVPINVGEGNFTLSTTFQQVNGVTDIFLLSGNVTSGISSSDNGAYAGKNITKASIDGYVTIAYRNYARETAGSIPTCQTMLNSGSTALSYEPYWK